VVSWPSAPRVALIDGVRTPFLRPLTGFAALTTLDLASAAVRALIARAGVPTAALGRIVFGQVVPSLSAPNLARELVFEAGLPRTLDASTVTRACTTGYRAVADLALAIDRGEIDAGIAGGADSTSDVPIAASRPLAHAVLRLGRARSLADRVRALRDLAPRDLVPVPPALRERATGLSMGEHAEQMARANQIARADQDAFAHQSHVHAAAAWADGRFADQVVPVAGADGALIARDNLVRPHSRVADYAALRPMFADDGSVTAGNASPLSDGASATLWMREDHARALGLVPLATIASWAFTALDPADQMLLGPAYAIPQALERAGLTLADVALVDLHEAFAAQVLSVVQALGSAAWARAHLGRDRAVGELDPARLNPGGGSIALGHPFAATGTRQLVQLARELRRRGGGFGVAAACAAGGLGAAMVLAVEP
jgi:acetyl-CoA acyltransferase